MPIILTPRAASATTVQLPPPLRLDSGSAVIGRVAGADMVIAHPLVSSRHCTITGNRLAWQVQDNSTNGTTVNGRRVTGAQTLATGDTIGLGEVELSVRIENAVADGTGTAAQINLQDWRRTGGNSTQPQPPQPPSTTASADPVTQLLHAAGLDRSAVRASDQEILTAAGIILRSSVEGLAAMLQARRKAREELRVSADPASANPLRQTAPYAALGQLLASPPAAAGEMVKDTLLELDRHERATLNAMQAAFRAALDQFAPEAIKQRTRDDAAAWKAYEKAFGANDGFVEVFAQELASSYGRLSAKQA
jgi:predicted component of type VI protein secretion system